MSNRHTVLPLAHFFPWGGETKKKEEGEGLAQRCRRCAKLGTGRGKREIGGRLGGWGKDSVGVGGHVM